MKEKIKDIKKDPEKKAKLAEYIIEMAEYVGIEDSNEVGKSMEMWKLFSTIFEIGQKKATNNKDLKILQEACGAEFLSISTIANHIKYLKQQVEMDGIFSR